MILHPTRILIVSCSTGSGHVKAARAIEQTIHKEFPDILCKHIDVADFITPLFKTTAVDGYSFLVSHLPRVWKSLFKLTDSARIMKAYRTLTNYLKKLNSFDFINEVEKFRPDHIICTHFLPAEILAHSQKKSDLKIPITEVITDYGTHPAWIVDGISTYIVATMSMKQDMIDTFKIPEHSIKIFGIPIDPAFYENRNPTSLKSSYDVPPTNPLILVLAGGDGLIDIATVLEGLFSHLKFPTTIVAVAGNNTSLHENIQKITPPPHLTYRTYGWTDSIPELMSMASVVISKPGGLTTTECVATGTPLIAINPIPGQEDFNIDFLSRTGCGALARSIDDIYPLLTNYLSDIYHRKNRVYSRSAHDIITYLAGIDSRSN